MPLLDYGSTFDETGIDGKKPQSWDNYVMPYLQTVRTLTNTTKFDYLNIQDDGLRTGNLRTHANVEAVRIKVRNATGSSIAAGSLVYFSGTYSDGTDSYPTIAKAVTTTAVGTTFFAQATTTAAIGDGADGTAAIFLELTGQTTSSGTAGDSIYLDTTAGGWTRTRPTGGQYVQVVGTITVVHASTGRVVLSLGSVPEHLTGGSSGLGATFQTLTVQGASGAAADVYHISDAGEDNADKWKISVADGGNRTWENYTSGSYAAKLTLTSAGALTVAGALNIGSVSAAGSDTDKFLVLDGSGNVDYRTGAEVLSDIGASAVAGSSSIVTVGALNSGSITSGFGTIDTGSSTITTTGALSAGATTISGDTVISNGYGLIVGNGSQVTANTIVGEVQQLGTANADTTTTLGRWSADATSSRMLFVKSRNGTIGSSTIVQDDDDLGNIGFVADDGSDFAHLAASITASVDGTPGANDVPGRLVFATTADGASSPTERLRISSAGSLSLGTTAVGGSPGAGSVQFHKDANNYVRFWDNATATFYMQSNAANAPTTAMKNSDSDSLDITTFQRTNAGGTILGQVRNGLMAITGAPNGVMAIGTSNSKNLVFGTNNSPNLYLNTNGHLGVNVSDPQSLIEVSQDSASAQIDALRLTNESTQGYGAKMTFRQGDTVVGSIKADNQTDDVWAMRLGTYNQETLLTLNQTGTAHIAESANGKMTQGLTIQQGDNDNEILALKSTAISQSCTDVAEADTFGTFTKYYPDDGGLQVTGFVDSGAQAALSLQGVTSHASPQSGKTSSNNGTVNISAYKVSSNDRAQLSANENILSIYGASATRFIFDADGDAYADSQWTTYDDHDDIAMLHALEATMVPDLFGKCMKYDSEYLQKTGIIGEGSIRQENGKTRAMINTNRLQMLHHGAIRQVHQQLQDVKEFYEDKIAALEARLLRLEA